MTATTCRLIGVLFCFPFLAGCGIALPEAQSVVVSPESAYCSNVYATSNPITITAVANYYYRQIDVNNGLTGNPVFRGIPFAEVVVLNSAGETIQCATTDASGNISFQISKNAGSYSIRVQSRAFNNKIKASVLSDPASNAVYSVTRTFSLTGSESGPYSAGTFYAAARMGSDPTKQQSTYMEGAAFHILYNIYLANEYIRSTVSSTFVADKVSAYWKPGFNPGSYVGTSDGMSFYISGESQLYILGGISGNVKTADTDHWDDSVIIHEYGHFLEDRYAKSSSPGGSHNGNFIIDPRLAWSEGWANFFQGAVVTWSGNANRGQYYIDTVGYSGDSVETGEYGMIAIKANLSASGSSGSDAVSVAGEGTFREMSIARFLYKVVTTTTITFQSIWETFSDTVTGLRAPANIFSNSGVFNKYLDTRVTSGQRTSWENLLDAEKQNKTTVDYADPLLITTLGTCTKVQLKPVVDSPYADASDMRSNKLRSNDFYLFHYDGSGGTLALNYSKVANGEPATIDLDLYLYYRDHVYQEDYLESLGRSNGTVAAKSDRSNALDGGVESINLSGLSIGYYLINVKAQTYGKLSSQLNGTAQYSLTLRGSDLCPEN